MAWFFSSGRNEVVVQDTVETQEEMEDNISKEGLNPDDFSNRSYWCSTCNCWHHHSVPSCEE